MTKYHGPGFKVMETVITREPDISRSFEITPVPASRARVPRFGKPYYVGRYATFREEAVYKILSCTKTLTGPLIIVTDFLVPKPRTSKLDYPTGDIDNYQKAIYDALTDSDGYWIDDRQIVSVIANKRFVRYGHVPELNVYIWCHDE